MEYNPCLFHGRGVKSRSAVLVGPPEGPEDAAGFRAHGRRGRGRSVSRLRRAFSTEASKTARRRGDSTSSAGPRERHPI